MSEKVTARASTVAQGELHEGELVLDALGGQIPRRRIRLGGGPVGRFLDMRRAQAEREQLRQAMEEKGLPLPNYFTLGITRERILIFRPKPPRNVAKLVAEVPLGDVADIRLGKRFAMKRFAEIEMGNGATFPLELVQSHEPDRFVDAFRAAKASG
jgi:hypothetical protein